MRVGSPRASHTTEFRCNLRHSGAWEYGRIYSPIFYILFSRWDQFLFSLIVSYYILQNHQFREIASQIATVNRELGAKYGDRCSLSAEFVGPV